MESLPSEFLAKRRTTTTTTTTTKKKKKSQKEPWPKKKGGVALEGYLEPTDSGSSSGSDSSSSSSSGDLQLVGRTKSLTEEDLEELRGCLDLGFGFSYHEIPELCSTLPALELCYSMAQRFLLHDHHHHQRSPPEHSTAADHAPPAPPLPNWNFSSPGDDPEEVKARLKYWAQTVACTVRLCS